MKTIITLAGMAIFSFFNTFEKEEDAGIVKSTQVKFEYNKASVEQTNPLFRWPLPNVKGEVHLNLEFVFLKNNEASLPTDEELLIVQDYMNSVYNPHGIFINYFKSTSDINVGDNLLTDWKDRLEVKEGRFVLYVFAEDGDELNRAKYYSTNDVASERSILPYQNLMEFKTYAAKNLAHMLGLFPTYFENSFLNVSSEDATNCGFAGDFVCDTPFDYVGIKNDVKKKNCKYKGEVGSPDISNILSNSWSECMDHITPGQANKIKYNFSVIPFLQQRLLPASTIRLQGD